MERLLILWQEESILQILVMPQCSYETLLFQRLHCGCVASKNSYDLLDSGGIKCVTCMKNSVAQFASGQVVPKLFPCPNNLLFFGKSDELLSSRKFGQPPSLMLDSRNDDIAIVNKSNHLFMVSGIEAGQSSNILRQKEIENGPRQIKWEQPTLNIGDMGRPLLTRSQSALESPQCTRRDDNKDPTTDSTTSESFPEACLSMNLGIANNGNRMEATSTAERPMLSPTTAIAEGRDLATALSPHKGLGISRPDHQGLVRVQLLIQLETCFRIFVLLDHLLKEGVAINYFLGIGQE
ncbi:B3 domain-containing transcription repressor VAL2 [Zea mays]|uniref:B3 domain-containing transcription repressor VAL2 n=1 Tax=Zea mays TaxID=4577 RepID=A0A1D6M3V1_MAIZE|nr:B3 domain-containing transcription repressor VAL2 [Zea mays]